MLIEHWVDEAHRPFADGQTLIIDTVDDGGEDGSACPWMDENSQLYVSSSASLIIGEFGGVLTSTGAATTGQTTLDECGNVVSIRSDIGIATAKPIVPTAICPEACIALIIRIRGVVVGEVPVVQVSSG